MYSSVQYYYYLLEMPCLAGVKRFMSNIEPKFFLAYDSWLTFEVLRIDEEHSSASQLEDLGI